MDSQSPAITVLMPVYNARKYLEVAIMSVLNQSFSNFEFLVINDGSTDGSLEVILDWAKKDTRIRLVNHKKNEGLVKTLNQGLKLAQSDIIARMDADDISLPKRFEEQLNFLNDNPDYCMVGCQQRIIDQKGKKKQIDPKPLSDYGVKLYLGYGCAPGGPTVLFRKEAVLKAGGFRATAWPGEDHECWVRIVEQIPDTKMGILPDELYHYRENLEGISLTNKSNQIQKTIDTGDHHRNTMIKRGWRFLSYKNHKLWFDDVERLVATQEEKEVLKRIYYTAQMWFINDQLHDSRFHASVSLWRLKLYTKLHNPLNYPYIFNQPRMHSFPAEATNSRQ